MAQQGKRLMSWFSGAEIAEINEFRRNEEEIPSLAAAIRKLAKLGLQSEKRSAAKRPAKKRSPTIDGTDAVE
jgi:hypothetical protein